MPDTERLRKIIQLLEDVLEELAGLTLPETDTFPMPVIGESVEAVRRWALRALERRELAALGEAMASERGGRAMGNGTAK